MEEAGPSSRPFSKRSAGQRQNFMLHVLSPSADFPHKLTFADVPVSATVGELKTKICNAVASRPSPERQRLIYSGKPLLRDTATLKDVFTEETVRLEFDTRFLDLTDRLGRSTVQNLFLYILSFPHPLLHNRQYLLFH